MSVTPVQSTTSLPTTGTIGTVATPAETSILPTPAVPVNADDALVALMKLSSETNACQSDSSRQSAVSAASQRKEATDKRQKALQDAIDAQKKAEEAQSKGGLFDFITDNLGPVGLIGMVVGSVYLVAADLALHATGLDDGKMDLADAAGVGAILAGPAGIAVYAAQMAVKKFGPEEIQEALDKGPAVTDEQVAKANKIAFALTEAELAIAATVATGGTCAPAVVASVGIAISTATQVAAETGALDFLGDKWKGYVTMAGSVMGAAGALGGGVAGLASGGLGAATGAANAAQAAATGAGGAAQATATVAAETAQVAVEAAGGVAEAAAGAAEAAVGVAKGVHDVVQGVRNYQASDYAHDADEHRIDAERQKHVLAYIDRFIEDVIGDMKELKDSAQRTSALVQSSIQTESQTLLMAGSLKV